MKSPDCESPRVPVQAIVDTTCGVTSVLELGLEQKLEIYPNPADNNFTIETNNHTINQIQILDLSGKLMRTVQSNQLSSKVIVNSLSWESGVYFVRINTDSGMFHKKIIVTH